MAQALYRKYRSKTFDEVVGQEHVTKTLEEALKRGRISHAYLFTGPRGVGKTSVARILAHEVNGLENSGEPKHLDIIEIDAASNRRIDEIREIRQRVHIAPAAAKYKVYIIDEVHMLTKEAFNALLKTLEEPPSHVIFILATTEAHKLPETIISRTQRFSFKPVSKADIAKHLEQLAKQEGISADSAVFEIIAEHSDGSVRDSVSLLDQLAAGGKRVDEGAARDSLGVPKSSSIDKLAENILKGDSAAIIRILDELKDQGINPAIAAKELSQNIRNDLIAGGSNEWNVGLLKNLISVGASSQPQEDLEISLLEAAASNSQARKQAAPKQAHSDIQTPEITASANKRSSSNGTFFDINLWPEILKSLKQANSSSYSAIRLARPSAQNGVLTLTFQFALHQKKADSARLKNLLADAIEGISGQRYKIDCVVDKELFKKEYVTPVDAKKSQNNRSHEGVKAISNIFGAAEVLES